jgi:isoleucyl-tRNA synthetase
MYVVSNREDLSEELKAVVLDELNIKAYKTAEDADEFISYKLKPQLKTLGPKYGAKLGKVKAFLETCNANELVATVKAGDVYKTEFQGDTFEFALDDLLISTNSAEGFIAASDKGITVVMDTTVTEELKAEGVVRELISKIQTMRKEAGFEVVDRIIVNFVTDDESVKNAMASGEIASVVLADAIVEGDKDGFKKELDINGAVCTVIINKVQK